EKKKKKILLNKKKIKKILGKIKKDGYTIIPLELFLENGWAKLEIALAKGKKLYDKRDDLAKKAQNRDIQRAVKNR
ncbi:MAG: SsrA-binding protein, partial [Candidatus Avigastranaerophilus sp.]